MQDQTDLLLRVASQNIRTTIELLESIESEFPLAQQQVLRKTIGDLKETWVETGLKIEEWCEPVIKQNVT